jgi:hypothetical protein
MAIELATALGAANMDPIGCFVARTPEAISLHKGFQ